MEPVTHFLTGACLGRSGFNRKTAYATLAMTIAAEAPDVDVIFGLGGPVTGFCRHRGMTHTFLGAPFMALAVTGLVWCIAAISRKLGRRPPEQPVRWGVLWLLCLLADGSHLLLDYTNNYGLRPLFPLNLHWFSWSIVFIFDPVLFAALLLGLGMPAVLGLVDSELRRRPRGELRGRSWAITALVAISLLYSLRNAEHLHAIHLVEQAGSSTREPLLRVAAEPVMADPFTWHALAETRSDYQSATVHTLRDRVDPEESIPKPPVTAAVTAARPTYLGRVYGDWSSWPVAEDLGAAPVPGDPEPPPPGAHTVIFRDLRFSPAALGPLAGDNADPVLAGYVVIGPHGELLSLWMNERQQR